MVMELDRRRLPSGRHGLPRSHVVRNQRERLLEAMIQVVSSKGYEATTVADVIEAAGVSRTTFYELFADKEDCFLQAHEAVFDVLLFHVEGAYRAHQGRWPERIHAALAALVGLLSSEPAIARVAMLEVATAGNHARQRYRDSLNRFLPFLDEGRGSSPHSNLLPASTSRLAIGAAATLIFDEVRVDRAERLGSMLPDLVFAVLLPFIGAEAAVEESRKKVEVPEWAETPDRPDLPSGSS